MPEHESTLEQVKKLGFDPTTHLMQIKNRAGAADYLPVQHRIVWFRLLCPQGTIETEIVHLDLDRETEEEGYQWNQETRRSEKVTKRALGFAVFRAIVKDGNGGVATGTKSEKAASFGDFLEKAESGAIGRALAALGYGTQFVGEEFDEKHRIADAPVDRPGEGEKITEDQITNLHKAYKALQKEVPSNLKDWTKIAAEQEYNKLSNEYRKLKKSA